MHSRSNWLALAAALCSLASVHLVLAQSQPTAPPSTPPPLPSATPDLSPARNPDESIPVVIHYGEGQEARATVYRGVMDPVGMPPGQVVTVTLLLAASKAGLPVRFGLYDGGQIGAAGLPEQDIFTLSNIPVVSVDGTVVFKFKAGRILGLYRLLLTIGPDQYLLQFYATKPRSSVGLTPLPSPSVNPPPLPTPSPIK